MAYEPLESKRLLAQTVGALINTPDAYEGYTLYSPQFATTTYLVDLEGREINRWENDLPNSAAYLMPNGDLVRVARLPSNANTLNAPGASGRVEIRDWDGNLKWYYELNTPDQRLHHDIEVMPNGNILLIAWERYTRAESLAEGRNPNLRTDNDGEVWPDVILEIEPDLASGIGGDIVWKWSLWDHLVQDHDPSKPNYGDVSAYPERVDLNYVPEGLGAGAIAADWTHFNAIDYNPELDQIVVSSREFSEFWVIDHSTTTAEAATGSGGTYGMGGRVLYRWGNPRAYDQGVRADQQLQYQHDAQWIEPGLDGAGNWLVFNNGWNRVGGGNYSSVEEIAPPERGQRWLLNNRSDGSINSLILYDTQDLPTWYVPLVGDWNNDGIDTSAFFDPRSGEFFLNNSRSGWDSDNVVVIASGLTTPGLIPVSGNWDGSGGDEPGLYDRATQTFVLSSSATAWNALAPITATGVSTDWLPITGDWDGDGVDGVGLYDTQSNDWLLANGPAAWSGVVLLSAPSPVPANWRPIAGDWNRNGRDSVGLYDPESNRWFLNNRIDGSVSDLILVRAPDVPAAYLPLAGDWNGNGVDTIGLYDPMYYAVEDTGEYGPAGPLWEYVGNPRTSFYSNIVSGAQRLPNGNTLINEGNKGEIFEVTPQGDIVWRYVNPVLRDDVVLAQGQTVPDDGPSGIPGVRANLTFRAYRYGLDYLDPSLDVTPGAFVQRRDEAGPELSPIADVETTPGGVTGSIPIGVTDADTPIEQLTFTASAQSQLYLLDQQLSLSNPQGPAPFGPYYQNYRGSGEKYLLNPAGTHPSNRWYYLLPNGDLYRFTGTVRSSAPSSLQGVLIASLGESVYADPSLLHNATSGVSDLAFQITTGQSPSLTVSAAASAGGVYFVTLTAADAAKQDATTFAVNVQAPATAAPELSPIADVETTPGGVTGSIPIGVTDADTPIEQLTFTASAQSQLYLLDQQLSLSNPQGPAPFGPYYQNYRGSGEKYLLNPAGTHPSNRWYYLLPNGDLYRFTGTVRSSAPSSLQGALIASLGESVYADPSLLHNATSGVSDLAFQITTGQSPSFRVSASASAIGPYVARVVASDGSNRSEVSFLVGVQPIQSTDFALDYQPGDYDGSGLVDHSDRDLWQATYGSRTDLRADGNNDGVVNSADYSVWRDNLGQVAGSYSPPVVGRFSGAGIAASPGQPLPFTSSEDDDSFQDEEQSPASQLRETTAHQLGDFAHIVFEEPSDAYVSLSVNNEEETDDEERYEYEALDEAFSSAI